MLVVCHFKRQCDSCLPEDKKKEMKRFYIDETYYKYYGIVSTKTNMAIKFPLLIGAVT